MASSSLGPERSSTWRAVTVVAPVAPRSGAGAETTSAAPPPPGSAANDLARTTKRWGPSPVKRAVAATVPPNSVCWLDWPSSLRPTTLVSTGLSSLTDNRPATSRPS